MQYWSKSRFRFVLMDSPTYTKVAHVVLVAGWSECSFPAHPFLVFCGDATAIGLQIAGGRYFCSCRQQKQHAELKDDLHSFCVASNV